MGGKKNKEPSYETAMEKLIELSGKDRNGEDENPEFKGNLDDYMNYFLGSRISLQKITSADGDEKIPLQVFVRDSNLISKLEELFSKLKNYNSKRLDLSHIHQIFLLLLQNGFEEKLTTLLRNIKEDIFYSISDINKIKIDSDYMWNFSRESHRTIINIKFIKLLQKTIKPHYIELSEKELKKENKKQYIDRLSKGKNHVIVINLDEVKDVEGFKAEAYAKLISDEKEKFRRLAYSLVDDDDGKAFFNNLEKTHPQEDMKVLREYFALLKEEFERKGVINKIKKTLDDMTQTERNFVKKILISLPKSSKQYIFSQYDPQVGNDLMNAMN